ncbi:MAG: Eco57I restriction-modification methylase domain-containing protein, partial [Bacteroidales bacterium]|nr:Eco57I restriction-modification methylase domain-containing protein [Bacteroidales bacterium]
DKAILENNLYGVDINEESVEIAKLSLWLRTAQKGRKLSVLSNNIKCGNSLIDDPEVAGDKAFDWNKEFPQVFRKKKKKAWHITTATHNSRYSQRMFDNHVKLGEAVWLSEQDEIYVTGIIADIVKEDNLNIIECNICGDHLHLLLVCEEEEMPKIVGKLKSVSGRKYNIENGITTRGHVPLSEETESVAATRGHIPLSEEEEKEEDKNVLSSRNISSPNTGGKSEKKKYNSLWTQKFGRRKITNNNDLRNVINYIRTNRQKHELPENKKLEKIISEMCCSVEHAFRTEYKGGFDVVIGNPPYVQINEYQEYYFNNYQTASCGDLYAYFIEKGILLLRKKGLFSFITPSLYIKGIRYESLRKYLLDKIDIKEILDKGDGVFQDVQMPTAILTFENNNNIKQNWNEFIPGYKIISKLEKNSLKVSDFSKIKRGLEIGKDKVYKNGNGKEILTGENISRYFIQDKSLISDETYLKFKKDEYYFSGKRVVIRETGNRLTSIFVNENIQQNRSLYSIKIIDEKIRYQFLLSLLNSSLIQYYYKTKFAANTDIFPKIRIAQVKNIPVIETSKEAQQPFIEKADKMLSLNQQLQKKKTKFLNRVKDNLETRGLVPLSLTIKISKKLDVFYDYDFKTFIAELNKQKINLSLVQQDEWEEYFNAYKIEINNLQSEINTTDKEIDWMVYELYGLGEEEIKIVESNVN